MVLNCLLIFPAGSDPTLLEEYIDRTAGLQVKYRMDDVPKALKKLKSTELVVDIIFLALTVTTAKSCCTVGKLHKYGVLICLGAEEKRAAEAFRWGAVDFLLEPLDYAHFLEGFQKAKQLWRSKQRKIYYLFVRESRNTTLFKVKLEEVLYLECWGNYVKVFVKKEKFYSLHQSMRKLLYILPSEDFIQINRSQVVRIGQIDRIAEDMLFLQADLWLKIGNCYRKELLERIKF